jgi:phage/conjugal plasmid C-4 type zinc finger TraR family protein
MRTKARSLSLMHLAREGQDIRRRVAGLFRESVAQPSLTRTPGASWEGVMDAALAASLSQHEEIRRQRLAEKSRAVADVRERVKEGRYGICELCGLPIPGRRLEAIPTAIRCVTCQEAIEAAQLVT